jgi:hypothetical protein
MTPSVKRRRSGSIGANPQFPDTFGEIDSHVIEVSKYFVLEYTYTQHGNLRQPPLNHGGVKHE